MALAFISFSIVYKMLLGAQIIWLQPSFLSPRLVNLQIRVPPFSLNRAIFLIRDDLFRKHNQALYLYKSALIPRHGAAVFKRISGFFGGSESQPLVCLTEPTARGVLIPPQYDKYNQTVPEKQPRPGSFTAVGETLDTAAH